MFVEMLWSVRKHLVRRQPKTGHLRWRSDVISLRFDRQTNDVVLVVQFDEFVWMFVESLWKLVCRNVCATFVFLVKNG
jgi:hypothetical protein